MSTRSSKAASSWNENPICFTSPCKAIQLRKDLIVIAADVVKQIVVKEARTRLLKLRVEDPVSVLFPAEELRVELRRKREAVARMPVNKAFLRRVLAPEAAVHPCSVKIGEAVFDKSVHHLLCHFHVYAGAVVGITKRKPHQTEP